MSRRTKLVRAVAKRVNAPIGELCLSEPDVRTLFRVCVELLDFCAKISGKIDPAASWLVAHARDEVIIGAFGAKL